MGDAVKETIVGIHQPNFLPWLGYFYKIIKSDTFVFLDNVQFSKNSFQNRVKIKTINGPTWLTLPIMHNYGQLTKDVYINNKEKWRDKHLRTMETNYRKTPFYNNIIDILKDIYSNNNWQLMTEINISLILAICKYLNIERTFIRSSALSVSGNSGELLINIVKKLNGSIYLSGQGGRKYQDSAKFKQAGITLSYTDFEHPVYPQKWGAFSEGLSIIDLLFNCGQDGVILLNKKR
jgi:hypothetical protein